MASAGPEPAEELSEHDRKLRARDYVAITAKTTAKKTGAGAVKHGIRGAIKGAVKGAAEGPEAMLAGAAKGGAQGAKSGAQRGAAKGLVASEREIDRKEREARRIGRKAALAKRNTRCVVCARADALGVCELSDGTFADAAFCSALCMGAFFVRE